MDLNPGVQLVDADRANVSRGFASNVMVNVAKNRMGLSKILVEAGI